MEQLKKLTIQLKKTDFARGTRDRTHYVNLCWIIGQIIAFGVLRGVLPLTTDWSYRIPFAVRWVWPIPLIIGVYFAPESPLWLVRKSRHDDAAKALRLFSKENSDQQIKKVYPCIHTNSLDLQTGSGSTYWLKGLDLRRTEIVCLTYICQNWGGRLLNGNSTYSFEQGGLAHVDAFDLILGLYAAGFCGIILPCWVMKYSGRRALYLAGITIQTCNLLLIMCHPQSAVASNICVRHHNWSWRIFLGCGDN